MREKITWRIYLLIIVLCSPAEFIRRVEADHRWINLQDYESPASKQKPWASRVIDGGRSLFNKAFHPLSIISPTNILNENFRSIKNRVKTLLNPRYNTKVRSKAIHGSPKTFNERSLWRSQDTLERPQDVSENPDYYDRPGHLEYYVRPGNPDNYEPRAFNNIQQDILAVGNGVGKTIEAFYLGWVDANTSSVIFPNLLKGSTLLNELYGTVNTTGLTLAGTLLLGVGGVFLLNELDLLPDPEVLLKIPQSIKDTLLETIRRPIIRKSDEVGYDTTTQVYETPGPPYNTTTESSTKYAAPNYHETTIPSYITRDTWEAAFKKDRIIPSGFINRSTWGRRRRSHKKSDYHNYDYYKRRYQDRKSSVRSRKERYRRPEKRQRPPQKQRQKPPKYSYIYPPDLYRYDYD